jgi:hypothetical protein
MKHIASILTVLGLMFWGCGETPNPTGEGTDSSAEVLNKGGNLPGNGDCTSYCARAIIHVFVGPGPNVSEDHPDFDEDSWVPFDIDGDGKDEICLREDHLAGGFYDVPMCMKVVLPNGEGACPEILNDPAYPDGRCPMPGDVGPYEGFWCRLMHGKDTHKTQ